jgi:RES domain
VDIDEFATSDVMLDRFHFLHSIERIFSMPVTPENRSRYTITQVIADILRKAGYGGLQFRSSVAVGYSLCIFHPAMFDWVPGSGTVISVEELQYRLTDLPSIGSDTSGYSKFR